MGRREQIKKLKLKKDTLVKKRRERIIHYKAYKDLQKEIKIIEKELLSIIDSL